MYDDENVIVCEITKPVNFLQFSHAGYGKEIDYLRNISESEKEVVKEMVQQRYREGKSYREIAKEFNISHMKVQRIIKGKDEILLFKVLQCYTIYIIIYHIVKCNRAVTKCNKV